MAKSDRNTPRSLDPTDRSAVTDEDLDREKRRAARRDVLRHPERQGNSPPEPNRGHRPSVEELGGTSEYQVRAATGVTSGDPMRDVVREGGDEDDEPLMGPRMATLEERGGAPVEGPLSQRPDELGQSFLRGAVQDPRVTEDDDDLPRAEDDGMGEGEQRMLDDRLGSAESEGSLVTSRPARAEVERELSEKTRRAGREVRTPRRGARIRDQSARVAELRGGATPRERKKPEQP